MYIFFIQLEVQLILTGACRVDTVRFLTNYIYVYFKYIYKECCLHKTFARVVDIHTPSTETNDDCFT